MNIIISCWDINSGDYIPEGVEVGEDSPIIIVYIIGDINSGDYIPEGVEAGEDSPIALHVSHKKKKK